MEKSDSQIIEDAVEIIKENGICKGHFHKVAWADDGSIVQKSCALGSVALVLGDRAEAIVTNKLHGDTYSRLRYELGVDLNYQCTSQVDANCTKDKCFNIAHFNDAKTAEQVMDQMMVTAKRLRNEGR